MLSKKHLVRIMSVETPQFKTVGLHYITFSERPDGKQSILHQKIMPEKQKLPM